MAPLYECWKCHKSFCRKSMFDDHINVHFEAKPYRCRYCPSSFANNGSRYHHERTHQARRHTCTCGKAFARPQELKRHQRRGTGSHLQCHKAADALPQASDDLDLITSNGAQRLFAGAATTPTSAWTSQGLRYHSQSSRGVSSHDPWTSVHLDSQIFMNLPTLLVLKAIADVTLYCRMYTGGVSKAELASVESTFVNATIQACRRLADTHHVDAPNYSIGPLAWSSLSAAFFFTSAIDDLAMKYTCDTEDQRFPRFQDKEALNIPGVQDVFLQYPSRRLERITNYTKYTNSPSREDMETLTSALVNFNLIAKDPLKIESENESTSGCGGVALWTLVYIVLPRFRELWSTPALQEAHENAQKFSIVQKFSIEHYEDIPR